LRGVTEPTFDVNNSEHAPHISSAYGSLFEEGLQVITTHHRVTCDAAFVGALGDATRQ